MLQGKSTQYIKLGEIHNFHLRALRIYFYFFKFLSNSDEEFLLLNGFGRLRKGV